MPRSSRSRRTRSPRLHSDALRDWQKLLLGGIWVCFGLMTLMPFVVTLQTAYPFIVGKALYARSVIEIAFGLWVVLAVGAPAYRPPRSWLLRLLGLVVLAGFIAACFGVAFQRSLWSTYERMQGVVEALHWFAFAAVLFSVVKTSAQWRLLFNLNLAASIAMTALATLRFFDIDFSHIGAVPEASWRISASLGNPTYLGAYAVVNLVAAVALLGWSFAPGGAGGSGARGAAGSAKPWRLRAFWLVAALCNLQSLMYSGSLGATVALLATIGFVSLLYALFGRLRVWRMASAAVAGVFAVAGVALAALFFTTEAHSGGGFSNPLLNRISQAGVESYSSKTRIAAWGIALEAFAEKPLTGWGPENYVVPFGRYAEGFGATMTIHDNPHNELLEHAATRGALGVGAYLALWVLVFAVVVRGARAAPATPEGAREQILTLGIGGALMADFIVRQALFNIGVSQMQYLLLLCYAAGVERAWPAATPAPLQRLWARLAALAERSGVRLGIAAAACALAAFGLIVNQWVHAGAVGFRQVATAQQTLPHLERAVQAFPPLANYARRYFFVEMANNWRAVRRSNPALARQMLERADIESKAALELEPENWLLHRAVSRLYMAVASTEPQYREIALAYRARAVELSPNRTDL